MGTTPEPLTPEESHDAGGRPRLAPFRSAFAFAQRYERHLSALSLVGGYVFDTFTFGRIDRASTHIVFVTYLAIAGGAIAISHRLESRPAERQPSERTRTILTAITQFGLGCLLSGFCVFYLRSASLWASWPYLLLLASVFVGNEFLKRYTTRFTFALLLYFFALFSYAILVVPVVVSRIGPLPFLASGLLAMLLFWLFVGLIRLLGRDRWRAVRLRVLGGVVAIAAAVNLFYFVKILPPLPLALADADVYLSVKRVNGVYRAVTEPQPWTIHIGRPPVMHTSGKVFVYSAVFAPVGLSTTVVHHWQRYDGRHRRWTPVSNVAFRIQGGRDAGYRGYSVFSKATPGQWRVDITTADDRPLGRVRFAVAAGPPPSTIAKVLN